METNEKLLQVEADKLGIILTNNMMEKFFVYKKLLKEWNEKINLTAITDDREILIKHFVDSLTIEKEIPLGSKVIDVGTGAGFPGIPLKIIRDDIEVLLVDSLNKRVSFLNEVIDTCNLKKISAIHGRAEDVGHDVKYREKFDIATARAVANIATLVELCSPFVKIGGDFICMKANAKEEIKNAEEACKEMCMTCEKINNFRIEAIDAERTIIIYKKVATISEKYSRKAGIPAKSPIQ